MSAPEFVIGETHGIVVNINDALESLEAEGGRPLTGKERALAQEYLRDVLVASQRLSQPHPGFDLRVGEGRYVAVGKPGQAGLAIVLGPLGHIIATKAALSAGARLIKFDRRRRPHLITIYAQLEGDDRHVFEAIHSAQQRLIVVNYDAEKARQFAKAYGREAPTPGQLVEALYGSVTASQVLEVLADLVSKGILNTDGDRYWIAF